MAFFAPCATCLGHTSNGGGAHPLVHVAIAGQSLCVDVGIAAAVTLAWELGLETSNSCQAWGEWDSSGAPCPRRVDLVRHEDAVRLAAALGLVSYVIRTTPWGHAALTWLEEPVPVSDPRSVG